MTGGSDLLLRLAVSHVLSRGNPVVECHSLVVRLVVVRLRVWVVVRVGVVVEKL